MELIGIARGWINHLEQWIDDVKTIHIPYELKIPKKGKIKAHTQKVYIRVAVRPIQLLEIVFPKKGLNTVLGMVCPPAKDRKGKKNEDYILDKNPKNKALRATLRKAMGLKKLPKEWSIYPHVITDILKRHAVVFHPIGIKEDRESWYGEAL